MMTQLFASDPKVLNGAACFAGTGVPVQSLFDYLSDGQSVGAFLADFPAVSWEQVDGALEERGDAEIDCLPRVHSGWHSDSEEYPS